jgi:hypothetical protein
MNLFENFNTLDCIILVLGITLINYSIYCLHTQSIPLGFKTIDLSSSTVNVNANTPDQGIDTDGSNFVPTEEELLYDFLVLNRRPIEHQDGNGELRLDNLDEINNHLNLSNHEITSTPFIKDWINSIIEYYEYIQLFSLTMISEIINIINYKLLLCTSGLI